MNSRDLTVVLLVILGVLVLLPVLGMALGGHRAGPGGADHCGLQSGLRQRSGTGAVRQDAGGLNPIISAHFHETISILFRTKQV